MQGALSLRLRAGRVQPDQRRADAVLDAMQGIVVATARQARQRSEEHTSELQSLRHLVCRLLLEKKKKSHRGSPREPKSVRCVRVARDDGPRQTSDSRGTHHTGRTTATGV